MPDMKNETQSGMKRMINSKKSNQIPSHEMKIIDGDMMKMLSTDSEIVIHY